MVESKPLKRIIEDVPEGTVIFRTDYPQYHAEFVGNVLSQLVEDGILIRLSQGIYYRPKVSRFGAVKPPVSQVAESIAKRDNAQILPVGETALNELGLSTQIPMNYTFVTNGSARKIKIDNRLLIFKRGVPRNFVYKTRLMAYLVQAMKALGKDHVGSEEINQINNLLMKEPDKESLYQDLMLTPAWMRNILSPLIKK